MNNIDYNTKEVKQIIKELQKETNLSYTDIVCNYLPHIKQIIQDRLKQNNVY